MKGRSDVPPPRRRPRDRRVGPPAKWGPRWKQLALGGIKIDLFIGSAPEWGILWALRTGPAEFSRRLVTPRAQGGALPDTLRHQAWRLWRRLGQVWEPLDTSEERLYFAALGLPWIKPEQRSDAALDEALHAPRKFS